mgnify:CR=1 FL=1|jgi:hypothetical protein
MKTKVLGLLFFALLFLGCEIESFDTKGCIDSNFPKPGFR